MRMQICMELAFAADISLDQGLFYAQAVVLGLAHQGLGDGRDGGLELNAPVSEDVGDLCSAQTQDIHPAVPSVKITGNLVPDDQQAVFILRRLKTKELCEVANQVSRVVVRRPHDIVHPLPVHIEIDDNVFLAIQIKLLEKYDTAHLPSFFAPIGFDYITMIAAFLQVKRDRRIPDGVFGPGLAGTVTQREGDRLQTGMLAGCVFPFF